MPSQSKLIVLLHALRLSIACMRRELRGLEIIESLLLAGVICRSWSLALLLREPLFMLLQTHAKSSTWSFAHWKVWLWEAEIVRIHRTTRREAPIFTCFPFSLLQVLARWLPTCSRQPSLFVQLAATTQVISTGSKAADSSELGLALRELKVYRLLTLSQTYLKVFRLQVCPLLREVGLVIFDESWVWLILVLLA